MPSRYVRMDILTNGADKAKRSLEELYLDSEKLDGKSIDMNARLGTTDFTASADELKRKADILNKYRIELNAKVGGTDVIDAKLLGIKANIDSVYRKLDEKHDLSIGGLAKANADLIRIKMELDKLPREKTIDVRINQKGHLTNAGGGSVRDTRSLFQRFANTPGSDANQQAIQGLLSGNPGGALMTPEIIGPLASGAAMLLPGLAGLGVGGGVALGNAGLAAMMAQSARTKQAPLLSAVASATTPKAKAAAQAKLNAFDSANQGPVMLGGAMAQIQKAIVPPLEVFKGLTPIFAQFAKFLNSLAPLLSSAFKASLPFLKGFVGLFEQAAKYALPQFTQMMQQMVKSGALKLMMQGLLELVKGLVQFMAVMGPEMRTSAMIFAGVCKGLQVAFNVLGVVIDYVTGTIHLAVQMVIAIAKVIGDLLTGKVKAAWAVIKGFGHDVADTFDKLRHVVAEALDNMGLAKFGHTIAHTFDDARHDAAVLWHDLSHYFDNIKHDVMSVWDGLWKWCGQRWSDAVKFFKNLALDLHNGIKQTFDNIRHDIAAIWDGMWNWVGSRITTAKNDVLKIALDLHDKIKTGFDNIRHDVASIWDHLWSDIHGATETAISKLGTILNKIKNAFNAPFAWVGNNVLEPLSKAWNWIAGHTGHVLPTMPTAFHLAAGGSPGRIMAGRGQGIDDVPALIGRDETVVSASHSRMLAPVFAAAGVPGYAAGGIPNPLHLLSGLGHDVAGWGHDLGSVFGMLGRGGIAALEHIPGISALSSIMAPIAKGVVGAAAHGAEALINGTLGTRPEMMTGAARASGDLLIGKMADAMASAVQAQSAVAGNGSTIAKYAEQFRGHPYVLGGSGDYQTKHSAPYGPWDCAGFVGQMYHHYGIDAPFPGINVGSLRRWAKFVKTPEVGGMAFWVTDGTKANPGHVGMVTGKNKSIQAMDPQMGTRDSNLAGALDYAVPPHGWGTAAGTAGAVGKGYVNIGKGLMREGFGRAAAAGIVGDIAGESGGNPESVGSGGWGLIGWTGNRIGLPAGVNGPTGNVAKDMSNQVAGIKGYVEAVGSMADMNRYKSALQAAYHFSIAYEKPKVTYSDVRGSVANSTYAALDTGEGWLKPGMNMLYNGLGRMEHLVDPDRYKNQGGGTGGMCLHINVEGAVDGDATAKQIVQLINARARHNGGKTGIIQN